MYSRCVSWHRSVCPILFFSFFCILVKYYLSVLYRSLASHSCVVQSARFASKIGFLRFLFVTFLFYLAWYINRTLSSLGSQFNTHTSLHLPFTNIGPLLQRFLSSYIFIEYSPPIPPFLLPIPYNLCYTTQRGCKFLCTGLCLGVAVYGSGNNKTRYNHGMSR